MNPIYFYRKAYQALRNDRLKTVLLDAARCLGWRTLIVRIDTNNVCNCRCKMCPSAVDLPPKSPLFLSLSDFRELATLVLPRARGLYLSCAFEPMLTPRFETYLDAVPAYHVPFVSLCTNGQRLTAEVVSALIRNKIHEIIFSVDGATAPTYEGIRIGARFDRLMENLERLVKEKQRQGSRRPALRFNYTVSGDNEHEIEPFVLNFGRFLPEVIQFRGLTYYESAPVALRRIQNPGGVLQQIEAVKDLCRRKRIRLIFDANSIRPDGGSSGVDQCVAIPNAPGLRTAETGLLQHFLTCPVRRSTLYFKSNGDFHVCPIKGPAGRLSITAGFRQFAAPALLKTSSLNHLCDPKCPMRPMG